MHLIYIAIVKTSSFAQLSGFQINLRNQPASAPVVHRNCIMRTDALHCKVQSLVTALYPTVTIHDFRVIWGVTHSNIVFDAAVPFAVKDSDAVITQKLEAEIQKLDPDYRTVVTIDRR